MSTLDAYEDAILFWARQGIGMPTIVKMLKTQQGVYTTYKRLRNWFNDRGGIAQYHPKVRLKDEIIALGNTHSFERIANYLVDMHEIYVSPSVVRAWFLEWGVRKPAVTKKKVPGKLTQQLVNPYVVDDCVMRPRARGRTSRFANNRVTVK